MKKNPFISVIIPVYNEENFIPEVIQSLRQQTYDENQLEIIIVDGNSQDKTPQLLKEYQDELPQLIVLHNPDKIVPISLNMAIEIAKGQYIIRWDCHSKYANDYLEQCVNYLNSTGADNVGGPIRLIGDTPVRQAIKLATTCPFGIGNSQFHYEDREKYVDTVYLGAFRREVFDSIGMFDEELVRNQDDEFNFRLIQNGGKIFLTPAIQSYYYPRSSLNALWKQYYQYGYWKVRVIQKHKRPASIRHLIPGAFVFTLGLGVTLLPVKRMGLFLLTPTLGSYLTTLAFFTGITCRKHQFSHPSLLAKVFATLHVSYGSGFLKGLIDFGLLKKPFKKRTKRNDK